MAGRLEGKVAVITGAGSGIGRATALRFVEEGARVVANDLDPETLKQTVEALTATGGQAKAVAGDVTDSSFNDALVAAAVDTYGRLDVFHCNAGGARPKPMHEITDEEYRAQIALNLDGVWYGTQAALRVMVPQKTTRFAVCEMLTNPPRPAKRDANFETLTFPNLSI